MVNFVPIFSSDGEMIIFLAEYPPMTLPPFQTSSIQNAPLLGLIELDNKSFYTSRNKIWGTSCLSISVKVFSVFRCNSAFVNQWWAFLLYRPIRSPYKHLLTNHRLEKWRGIAHLLRHLLTLSPKQWNVWQF